MSDMLPIVFWHVSWAGGTKVDHVLVVKVGREQGCRDGVRYHGTVRYGTVSKGGTVLSTVACN